MVKLTKAFLKLLLTKLGEAALAEDGLLVGCKLYLFKNTTDVNGGTPFADLTQPTYTGYAASAAVTLTAPFMDENGDWRISTDQKLFQCTGGTPDEDITGAALAFGANPNEVLYAYEVFDEPVKIAGVGEGLLYGMSIRIPTDGDAGSGTLVA